MEKKCPYCGAETRPGDNYCLNCGNPLLVSTPSAQEQAQPATGDATQVSPEDWPASAPGSSQAGSWPESATAAAASAPVEPFGYQASYIAPTVQATMDRIEQPARLILRADNGDIVQEYPLDKPEMTIGRAQSSDILLSKDKLTSRRHATVQYENGQYVIRDEHSANGTFVNGQQIEEMVPHTLQDGDHVGIGEHELIFRAFGSESQDIDSMPTISAPFEAGAQAPAVAAAVASQGGEDFKTHETAEAAPASKENTPMPETPQATPVAAEAEATPSLVPASTPEEVPETPAPGNALSGNITLSHLTSLELPALPEISALMAALSTLDGQIANLQNDLNATQEALRKHQSDAEQVTNQVRSSLRHVSERMDKTIADVARSRETLGWSELSQLMEDVMNNPRDIEYVTKLARKAREMNKIFQLHQNVLNAMAECNSLLRSLIGDE